MHMSPASNIPPIQRIACVETAVPGWWDWSGGMRTDFPLLD